MKHHHPLKNKVVQGVLIAITCAAAVAALTLHGSLEILELKTFDHRVRKTAPWDSSQGSPADIALVLIDQTSLEMVSRSISQRWPWPREFYAKMIGILHQAGAKAIVFDMYFTEPDMDRPEILGADSDASLAAATTYASNVVHSYLLYREGEVAFPDEEQAIIRRSGLGDTTATNSAPSLTIYTNSALPEAALTDAAAAIGFVTQAPDSDNICRRQALLARFGDATVKSQALAAAEFLKKDNDIILKRGHFQMGATGIDIDASASFYLHWYRPAISRTSAFDHYSAYNVLRGAIRQEAGMDPDLPKDAFKDRIVFIGSSATGLLDTWATPFSKTTPGVEIQATALANLLRGETVARIPRPFTLLMVVLLALTTAAATSIGRRYTAVVTGIPLGLLVMIIVVGYAALIKANLFIEMVPPVLVVFSTFLISTLTNYLTERKHSRMVRGIFEHYLDSSVVEKLIADPDKVRLGGERRECTVMFTDVADFTTTSESLSPEQVVRFMNIYLDAMTDIIIAEGGFVDKFIGDEIVAVFGAPNPLPDHAARACRAALRMAEAVTLLQPAFREAGCQTDIFARTGMCTGDVIIGNMGSENRMNYTAMGNTMNLGARIQGITKMYGARIFVSQSTALAAGSAEFVFREIDAVRVKGKQQAEHMVELLGGNTPDHPFAEAVTGYGAALEAYRRRAWDAALTHLAPLIEKGDGPAARLAARCREYQSAPPPELWDGVTTMLTK